MSYQMDIDTRLGMAYIHIANPFSSALVSKTVKTVCNVDYDDDGNILGVELFLSAATHEILGNRTSEAVQSNVLPSNKGGVE